MAIFKIIVLLIFINFSVVAVEFNEKEKQWIAENPNVTIVGDPNWLPFEAIDDKGRYIGIVAEYLDLISLNSGLTFNIVPTKTWNESINLMKSGQIDMISETNDSLLSGSLLFTKSYFSNQIVIAMSENSVFVNSIDEIKNKKIALIANYGYTDKIQNKYKAIDFVVVDDIQQGLMAVSIGRVDALVCTIALCSYTITDLTLNNVKVVGITTFTTELAFGVNKEAPELLSILNKTINNLTPNQKAKISKKWYKNEVLQPADYTYYYKVIAIIITVTVFVLLWVVSLFREIAKRKKYEKELIETSQLLKHMAYHDELTGLPSRRLGKDRLEQAMASVERNKLSMAVMFADLDGFKLINDTFGHDAGDLVIKVIGQRIKDMLRNTDTVARIGGDEFMFVLTDIKDISIVERVAEKIIDTISKEIIHANQSLYVGVSIGITIYSGGSVDADELMKEADIAMYKAKTSGKGIFVFYQPSLLDDAD
ncbi:diguanylate cyclase domain-containing protein [Colwellia piezophila]|uniref:diguanylate cyclase domain-containing protein n=1 Tax=Colwellia piezophila TaxID=211668 RepID=UPI00037C69BC|nr:diguanylate cyclase [Colwellia piezophila]